MTDFQYALGAQEDFNNMTSEVGKEVVVRARNDVLNYEGQEGESSGYSGSVTEVVFLQELDTTHEMVAAGELKVGDVRLVFQSDTTAEEEGRVTWNSRDYKIINFTKSRGENDEIMDVRAFGVKVPNR